MKTQLKPSIIHYLVLVRDRMVANPNLNLSPKLIEENTPFNRVPQDLNQRSQSKRLSIRPYSCRIRQGNNSLKLTLHS
jgi:hypothetical protein